MANGEDKSAPWYVNIILKYGIMSALGGWIIYLLANSYFEELPQFRKVLSDQNMAITAMIKVIEEENRSDRYSNDLIIRVLLANCINEANYDKVAIQRCLDDR